MTRRAVLVPLLAMAGSLSACASPHGVGQGTPPPRTRPATTATPTPIDLHLPLLAVLDHPFGAAPNTLRLLRADGGGQVAALALDPDAEAVATSGPLLLVAGSAALHVYAADGTGAAALSLPGSPDSLVRGLAGDPTGTHWLWASVTQSSGTATSHVDAAGPGTPPVEVASSSEAGSALQPLAWTAGGPVLSDEPLGIGGYVLFRRTFGATSLLDLQTRTTHPLTESSCAFSDLAADGSLACVLNGREAPNNGGPVTLRITRPGRAAVNVVLPSSVAQAGAALFSPDAATITLATSPALGEGSEQVRMELVDTATGARHAFGDPGLMPVGWLADGRLVAVRLPGVAGGDAGTYVVDHGGTATLLSTASTVAGILR